MPDDNQDKQKYDAPFFCDDGSQAAVDVFKEDPEKYYNIYQLTDTGIEQANSMLRVLMALPYKYPNNKVVIINTDDAWGVEAGAPVVHYQVQGGELQTIFTDPPTQPYKNSKFVPLNPTTFIFTSHTGRDSSRSVQDHLSNKNCFLCGRFHEKRC